ncbi:tRNA (adenosine(37)-N6)-dimethylallyltransferase MiaA [Micavibrio aeruginosavorus]|uniref:tRNA (adenosine(37)-N6)-dimethylallyltransferase MiaA n=1 Tax=Micavibrio aeruginosavorus TaxID=349221 RepID=UPI003F4AED20
MSKQRIVIIGGPTASGKSALAVALAQKLNGVVINADSMQVYDALPRLSAQPDPNEQAGIPHHLYAALAPSEICSAQIWRKMALEEIAKAALNGKTPVIVGGTGFYMKALTDGMSPMPDVPVAVRNRAIMIIRSEGLAALQADLTRRDPVMAARLHMNDTQRITRAWEVIEATGKSLADWQSAPAEPPPAHLTFDFIALTPPRDWLRERCALRFHHMMDRGVMDEVAQLQDQIDAGTVAETAPITNALGFRPLRALMRGRLPRDIAIERSINETRQYAKRQDTWFRHQIAATGAVRALHRLDMPDANHLPASFWDTP